MKWIRFIVEDILSYMGMWGMMFLYLLLGFAFFSILSAIAR